MLRARKLVLSILALALLAGCKHKEKTTPAPQAQAPVITTQPQPKTPPVTTPVPETKPEESNPPAPAATTPAPTPAKPKAPRHSTSAANPSRKPAQTGKAPAPTQPGTSQQNAAPTQQASNHVASPLPNTPGVSTGMPADQAAQMRRDTDQLLDTAQKNLNKITRALTAPEQKMADDIRNYIRLARNSETNGDLTLARDYASKARQLSDILAAQ